MSYPTAPIRRTLALGLVMAAGWLVLPQVASAAPPTCLTNLVANVFAGQPTAFPAPPCNDPDGDALTFTIVSGPDHGVLTGPAPNGTSTYTAAASYVGTDVIRFKATAGGEDSAVSTLTITVKAPPGGGTPPPGGTTVSIQNGVLTVDDAGGGRSTKIFIALYASPFDGSLNYMGTATPTSHPTAADELHAGLGCHIFGAVMCPAAGVTRMVVHAGDGNDHVTIGYPDANAPAGHARPVPVPVSIDLGPGNDTASATTTAQAVRYAGGGGNDVFGVNSASTLDMLGGPGRDRFDFFADENENDFISTAGFTRIRFGGGPGADSFTLNDFDGAVRASGDGGNDRLLISRTERAVALLGGRGRDRLTGLSNRGKALLDAGKGNDTLFVSRQDDADRRDNGGISTVRAGRGNDTLYVMSDGDRDLIDCGPGPDRFRFTELGVRFPPRENRYRRCPPTRAR